MEYTQALELDLTTLKPKLSKYESILSSEGDIGIYDRDQKYANYQQGRVMVTQYAIYYLSDNFPETYSFKLPLNWINKVTESRGFITSSPKLTIFINKEKSTQHKLGFNTNNSSNNSLSAGLSTINEWECKICQQKNFNSNACSLCGVVNQPTKDSQQKEGSKSDSEGIICSTCTFINHSELKFCEVCEAPLPDKTQLPTFSPTTSPTGSSKGLKDDSYIKLSFRKGGLSNILTAINKALAQKRWETQDPSNLTNQASSSSSSRNINNSSGNTTNSFGIDSLIKQNELKNNQINTELTDAFSDLDKLMEKATIMIDLANSINNKLKASSVSSSNGGDSEKFELDKIMASIGIESPVTQKTSGDKFFLDLSRELSLFLLKFIDKKPYQGLIDLVEVYCIFNKARTLNLVSPTDLLMACNQFDKVGSPLTIKKFGNGVTIIQSERFNLTNLTSFILDKLNSSDEPLIIRELAIEWNLSLSCAEEYIKLVELEGHICRDESVEGVKFYKNRIVEFMDYY